MSVFQNYPPADSTPKLSLGIEKAVITALSEATEDITDPVFYALVENAFCLVYPQRMVKANLPKLVQVVIAKLDSYQKKGAEGASPHRTLSRSFGTKLAEWLSDLDSSAACLMLAQYDVTKAQHWYWFEDAALVTEALTIRAQQFSQETLAQMEACMYGFGGKYSDDHGGDTGFDLTSGEGKEALRALGF